MKLKEGIFKTLMAMTVLFGSSAAEAITVDVPFIFDLSSSFRDGEVYGTMKFSGLDATGSASNATIESIDVTGFFETGSNSFNGPAPVLGLYNPQSSFDQGTAELLNGAFVKFTSTGTYEDTAGTGPIYLMRVLSFNSSFPGLGEYRYITSSHQQNSGNYTFESFAVPEPSTYALLGSTLLLPLISRRKVTSRQ